MVGCKCVHFVDVLGCNCLIPFYLPGQLSDGLKVNLLEGAFCLPFPANGCGKPWPSRTPAQVAGTIAGP
jgi:hypothetical protein